MKQFIVISAFLTFIILLSARPESQAQLQLNDNKAPEKVTPKEFSIPGSPLFDLLGAAPGQVARTSDIKDFKVDWSFKNWRINPNLAIEAQPIWEIFYNRNKIEKYQRASYVQRMLSSLDISLGTVQGDGDSRRLGGAAKINLYRQKDILLIQGAYDDIEHAFDEELVLLKSKEKEIMKNLDTLLKPTDIQKAREELKENDEKLASFYSRRNAAIKEKANSFITDNWNKAYVDAAYGKVYTYTTDSAGSFRKLSLNRNTGDGFWLNFGFGVGKRGLVSGLVRSTFYQEELNFSIKDKTTGEESTETAIASNRLYTMGINFRYGGPVYNFFTEFIWEGKKSKTALGALTDVFTAPDGKEIIAGSVKWDQVRPYTINIGGDWRISRNVIINYGVRWIMDNNFKTTSFTPIANISCMMR